jgi:hypothetical protein
MDQGEFFCVGILGSLLIGWWLGREWEDEKNRATELIILAVAWLLPWAIYPKIWR